MNDYILRHPYITLYSERKKHNIYIYIYIINI